MEEAKKPKTHCIHGHEFTPENTDWQQGGRRCIACRRITQKRLYEAGYYKKPAIRKAQATYNKTWYLANREKMRKYARDRYARLKQQNSTV